MDKQNKYNDVAVLGAGRWGSAVSIYLQRLGFNVSLFAHSPTTAASINQNNCSPYLPNFKFQSGLNVDSDINRIVKDKQILFITIPTIYIEEQLAKIEELDNSQILIGLSKGIAVNSLQNTAQITKTMFPNNRYLQLGGPCFPEGILAEGSIAAETLAGDDKQLTEALQQVLSSKSFRIYTSDDVAGVAMMGAIKNVFAIAAGAIEGLELNSEAKAILVTRGLFEMNVIGKRLNVKQSTIYGLSGLGDLILTCFASRQSHNYRFGRMMVELKDIDKVLDTFRPSVPEGYYTTKALFQLSQDLNIEAPLTTSIYHFLYHGQSLPEIIVKLMSRPLTTEDKPEDE